MKRIYLDHNATTPLDPRVLEAMLPWLSSHHGNPSSVHAFGRAARDAVETARAKVAGLIGAQAPEIVFTASGTESNNAAIFSCALAAGHRGSVAISAFEHPSVVEAAARLRTAGMETLEVGVETSGLMDPDRFAASLRDDTRIACLMLANNEVGTLQPVSAVAEVCRGRGVPLLCDAVQAIGKVPVDVGTIGADFLSIGGHKFHGPLGVGALWVRSGVELDGLLVGGSQERRRRASTENVAGIVGLGEAAAHVAVELEARASRMASLRQRLEEGARRLGGVIVHCAAGPRLPSTSNLAVSGVAAQALMIRLDLRGCAVSAGSACASGAARASRTLQALGIEQEEAGSSIRVSLGATTTRDEIDRFLVLLDEEVAALRKSRPEREGLGR